MAVNVFFHCMRVCVWSQGMYHSAEKAFFGVPPECLPHLPGDAWDDSDEEEYLIL